LGRIPLRAADGTVFVNLIDQDLDHLADLALKQIAADLLLRRHEAMPAFFLYLFRYGTSERIGLRAFDGLVLEASGPADPGFTEPLEQECEILFRLSRKSDDEGRTDREIGTNIAPTTDAFRRLLLRRRTAHRFQHRRRRVLKRNVEIRQYFAFRHQRDHIVDMRIRIDVVQAHPGTEVPKCTRQIEKAGLQRRAFPRALRIFEIDAISARVLADDEQLFDAGFDEAFGLGHDVVGRPARQIAAQRRNDAEGAAVVAAF